MKSQMGKCWAAGQCGACILLKTLLFHAAVTGSWNSQTTAFLPLLGSKSITNTSLTGFLVFCLKTVGLLPFPFGSRPTGPLNKRLFCCFLRNREFPPRSGILVPAPLCWTDLSETDSCRTKRCVCRSGCRQQLCAFLCREVAWVAKAVGLV